MLTLAAVLASSIPLAACGGKSSSSSTKQSTSTTTPHKYKTKPGY
jgi:hypothetical protein